MRCLKPKLCCFLVNLMTYVISYSFVINEYSWRVKNINAVLRWKVNAQGFIIFLQQKAGLILHNWNISYHDTHDQLPVVKAIDTEFVKSNIYCNIKCYSYWSISQNQWMFFVDNWIGIIFRNFSSKYLWPNVNSQSVSNEYVSH